MSSSVVSSISTASAGRSIGSWLTVERLAYLAIGLLAAVLRFAGLGQAPIGPAEAQQAVAALGLLPNASAMPPAGVSPLLLSLHAATFAILHSTEALARFWPALAGALLVFLPFGIRHELGRLGALMAALLLALSSSLIFWSRSATGESFALLAATALVVGLANYRREHSARWLVWLAAALALLLLSAPASYMILLLLAPLAVLALWRRTPDSQLPASSAPRSALATAGVVFAAILLLGATAFFLYPGGLAAVADLPAAWLRQFGPATQPTSLLWSLLQVVIAEPLLLVLGAAGLVIGLRRRDWLAQGLGLWLALALALIVVRPGRNPFDVALLALPLALLGGAALALLVQSFSAGVDEQHLEAAALFVAGVGVLISVSIWLANYAGSWNPQPQKAFLISAAAATAVLAVIFVAYALIFGGRLTARVGLALLLALLLVISLKSTMQMSHNRDGLVWSSFLRTTGAGDGPNLTAYVARLAGQRGGDLRDTRAVLVVAPGAEPSPLLRWYLRDAQVREAAGAADASADEVLVSLADDPIQPAAPPGSQPYSGRSFRIAQSWTPDGLRGKTLWNWLLYGHYDGLDAEQRAVVWVSNQPAAR